MAMKRILGILARVLALATVGVWLLTGAHRGWTRTSATVMRVDAVTGLEYPETRRKLAVGVELLGVGLGGALALWGGSFLAGRRRPS